tara:strand:+ start:10787 stop:12295 length:1509 start_codon:yes stop_codon:yes gene_type:complete
MATNTIRLHLNTADGELEEVDNVKNHANCKFNLARATISAISDQILSIALVKAVIPSNTTSIGYDNNKAAFGIGDVKLFITSSKTVLPVSGADVYIPLTFIHGPKEILDLLNSIHKINNPSEGGLVIDEIDKTLKIDPLFAASNYRINNSYFIKGDPLFSDIGLKIAQILGINTNTDVAETVFGSTPKNTDIQYQVGLAQVPLKLATNLGLDSVLSGVGSRNNILSNIPINISNQSQVIDVEFETTEPPVSLEAPVVVETEQKVNLDGSNDHINIPMDSNNPVLNWDESWSIGFTAEEVHGHDSGQGVKRTIATRGTNGIYLIIGTGNVGFYASATDGVYDPANNQGMTHAHGANTWYPSPSSVKWLFTYNHTTGKLKWFVGEIINGSIESYVQRGVITMTTTERTINQSTEDLNIGDAMEGYYGSTYFDGHLDDLVITNNEMTGQQIVDYYTDDDFESHEYFEHIVSLYDFNQEFPNVDDQVGNYNGTHQGSTNSDNFIAN